MLIGLTGGIGTGKSTVAKMFEKLGAFVISADADGHTVLDRNYGIAYKKVVSRFLPVVPQLLLPNGDINRKVLGTHVFLNPKELEALDSIVHPAIRDMFNEHMDHIGPNKFVVYECAILYEAKLDLDRHYRWGAIVATWCPEELQIQRVMERDGVERSDALMRIERQMPAEEKAYMADFSIDTSASLEEVAAQVHDIYDRLITVA